MGIPHLNKCTMTLWYDQYTKDLRDLQKKLTDITAPSNSFSLCDKQSVLCKKSESKMMSKIIQSIKTNTPVRRFKASCKKMKKISFNMHDKSGMHVLSKASQEGNEKLIDYIVKTGGNDLLKLGDHKKITALWRSLYSEQWGACQKLIEKGADINELETSPVLSDASQKSMMSQSFLAYTYITYTPLEYAALFLDDLFIELLLENGAKIQFREKSSLYLYHLNRMKNLGLVVEKIRTKIQAESKVISLTLSFTFPKVLIQEIRSFLHVVV